MATAVDDGLEWDATIRDHTQRATWMGEKVPLDLTIMYQLRQKEMEEREKEGQGNGA